MEYVQLLLAVVLLAVDFAFVKLYQIRQGQGMHASLQYSAVQGLLCALVLFGINGFRLNATPFSLGMAFLSGALAMAYKLIGFRILAGAQMSLYTFFLLTGGMTVPFLWGVVFLGETISALRVAGLLIIAAAIFLSGAGGAKANGRLLGLCLAVFVLNGFVSVVAKEHQISAQAVGSGDFAVWTNLCSGLLGVALLPLAKKKAAAPSFSPRLLPILLGSAVASGASYLLQLIGAKTLPATVLYPIITGGSVIFTALAGFVAFHERPSKKQLAGIALCFVGTCLFL